VEVEPVVIDVDEGNGAGVEPSAVDVDERDTDNAGPTLVAEVREDDAAESEPLAVDVEQDDAADAQQSAVDVVRADVTEAEPPAADVEEDAAEVEPSAVADVVQDATEGEPPAADLENADTTARDLEQGNPAKMPAPAGVLSEDAHARPQVPEQQVLEHEPVQIPAKRRGFGYLAAAATVLAALLIGALLFAVGRDRGVTAQSAPAVTATTTGTEPTSGPSNGSTKTAGKEPTIQLENPPETARASQTVRIDGWYRSGPDSFVQTQRWEGGQWVDFPLPAKADKSGRFTTFIELWQPGRYRLRVVDPHSGVRSKTFVLVVTG
jgi:hypothetical protein